MKRLKNLTSSTRTTAQALLGATLPALLTAGACAGSWEMGPSMPTPKSTAFAVKFEGAIYMVGGTPWRNGDDQDGSVYKLADGVWSEVATLEGMGPVMGQGGGVDALNHIIVFGGMTVPGGDIAENRAYDPVEGPIFTVTQVDITVPPLNFGTAVDDLGRIYRLGGGQGAFGLNSGICTRYIGATNSWQPLAFLPYSRGSIASAYDGAGHIWGFGGYTSFGTFRIVDTIRYTIATNTWQTMGISFLPVPTSDAKAVLGADGRIYIIGGHSGVSGPNPTATVYILDPRASDPVITTGPSLNVPRYDFGATLGDDGFIYVMGGFTTGGVPIASVERLDTRVSTLPGDVNGDGIVNGADLAVVLGNWGQGGVGDINDDGIVDGADLAIVLGNWTG